MDHDDPFKTNRTTLDNLPETKDIAPDVQIGETSRVTGSVRIGAQTTTDYWAKLPFKRHLCGALHIPW